MKISRKIILFFCVFAFASFLIFFRLTRADFQTDGAFYSMWSVGYLDYLFSDNQTTPIQWFLIIPWWARLSFHAHPPLVFLIQHIFFQFFGDSDFIALLPFALAGMGSLMLLYSIAKKLYNENLAILSVFILGISTFFTWAQRINYLEGMATFFILLAAFFIIQSRKRGYSMASGIAMGLSFLTKYTSFFLVPFSFLFLFWQDKKLLAIKKFFIFLALASIIFSPVIFYNIMLLITRGHPDVQFSQVFPSMFDAAQKDWPKLFTERQGLNPLRNFFNIRGALGAGYSVIFFITIIISSIYLIVRLSMGEKKHIPLALILFSLILEFLFIPLNERYAAIWSPFLALTAAVFIYEAYQMVSQSKMPFLLYGYGAIVGIIFATEIFFNINTNHFNSPIGRKGVFYSSLRVENLGFKNLEKFLVSQWKYDGIYMPGIKQINSLHDIVFTDKSIRNDDIYLFESGINWFAYTWYLQRQQLYHGIVITSDVDLFRSLDPKVDAFQYLQQNGVKRLFYIMGIRDEVLDASFVRNKDYRSLSEYLYNKIKKAQSQGAPITSKKIYNDNGDAVFEIYKIQLN